MKPCDRPVVCLGNPLQTQGASSAGIKTVVSSKTECALQPRHPRAPVLKNVYVHAGTRTRVFAVALWLAARQEAAWQAQRHRWVRALRGGSQQLEGDRGIPCSSVDGSGGELPERAKSVSKGICPQEALGHPCA